ncbi:hypothetical protein EDC18_102341 [Natranaerovirga pectinivora]|uniref:Uncharacterized protein n=1 Tax=Natranaerovirga pectinivora TaxID=682400 RepID=A0A4R3MTD8_9FIRM|nr:hypothetical protein [Natranaerovirga pectinivora]TCT16324.1 hypothetical protein EDC18_102341 [Natranaerovirga pectinivora]
MIYILVGMSILFICFGIYLLSHKLILSSIYTNLFRVLFIYLIGIHNNIFRTIYFEVSIIFIAMFLGFIFKRYVLYNVTENDLLNAFDVNHIDEIPYNIYIIEDLFHYEIKILNKKEGKHVINRIRSQIKNYRHFKINIISACYIVCGFLLLLWGLAGNYKFLFLN